MSEAPFEDDRPVSGQHFVDRSAEVAELTRLVLDRRNVLLVAPRRLGKTSLIEETFRRLPARAVLPVSVDVSKTGREHEVAAKILGATVRAAYGRARRGWEWVLDRFRRVRPTFSLHPLKGLTFGFDLADEGRRELEDVLDLLEVVAEKKRRPLVLAIDEFQNLLERDPGGETVGAMRGIIHHQKRVSYIFSGSKRHTLLGLVRDRSAPFWGQLKTVEIGGIPVREFAAYAKRHFAARGHPLGNPTLELIGELLGENPRRIQEALAFLYHLTWPPKPEDVDAALRTMLDRHRLQFEDDLEDVPQGHQKRLLLALAREGQPPQIYSKRFLQRHHLEGATFVKRAAAALRYKGILSEANSFIDPLFAHYLREE